MKKLMVKLDAGESFLDNILQLIQKEELLCQVILIIQNISLNKYFFENIFYFNKNLYINNYKLGAVEKQKLVYILNRDSAAKLTISSPLEAHKSHTIVYHSVGVDVGFENPIFACIEIDYSDADEDPTGEAFLNAEKVK